MSEVKVSISDFGVAKCRWCFNEAEGVTAKFSDGLEGHFCWKDFRSAVKNRSENGQAKSRKGKGKKKEQPKETQEVAEASVQ